MKSLLLKNFSWNFTANIIYALCQWLLLIMITRMGGVHDAGIYALGLAISAPFIMLINLNFNALQSTNLTIQYGFQRFQKIRFWGLSLFLLLFLIFIYISHYSFEIASILLLIAISKVIESLSDLYFGLFQYKERLDVGSKSTILRGVIGTICFGLGYYIFNELFAALLLLIFVWLSIFLFYDRNHGKRFIISLPLSDQHASTKTLLKMGVPLGLVACIASFNVNIPRFFIENYWTLVDLGYFSAVFYLVLIVGRFMTSLSSAVLPRLAKYLEEVNFAAFLRLFRIVLTLLLAISLTMIVFSYFFGSWLLVLFYGEEFKHLTTLLVFIMIYGLFNYLGSVFEIGLNAMKMYRFRFYNELFVTIVILSSSYFLIPTMGITGGALVLIIASILKCSFLGVLFGYEYVQIQKRC